MLSVHYEWIKEYYVKKVDCIEEVYWTESKSQSNQPCFYY